MLSKETIEEYRRMSLEERFALALQLMDEGFEQLFVGPPEVVDRRFELLRRENDLRNQGMLEGIARTKYEPATNESEAQS